MSTTKGNKKPVDQPVAPKDDPVKVEPGVDDSEGPQDSAYDSLPITVGNLKKNLGAILTPTLEAMAQQFEERLKEERDETTRQINAANQATMQTIKEYLEQLNASLNQARGGEAGQPQQEDAKGQIMSMLQPTLEKALNKYLGVEDAPPVQPLDRMTILLKTAIEREAQKVAMKSIKGALSKGTLFPEEVEQVLGDAVESAGGHRALE